MRGAATAGMLAAPILAAPPVAVIDWNDLRDMLLEMIGDRLAMEGYAYAGFAHDASLGNGESTDIAIRLGSGLDFIVVGECDGDCANLDLALYDAAGTLVASDFEPDDFPMVDVSPPHNGLYRLRIRMTRCDAASCRYAVQPLARPRGRPV